MRGLPCRHRRGRTLVQEWCVRIGTVGLRRVADGVIERRGSAERYAGELLKMMKRIASFRCTGVRPGCIGLGLLLGLMAGCAVQAQTAEQAWLKYDLAGRAHAEMPVAVSALGNDVLEQSAVAELRRNAGPLAGQDPPSAGFAERAGAERAGRTVVGTVTEMRAAFPKIAIPDLGPDAYWIHAEPAGEKQLLLIAGGDARGALYGAFAFLRSPAAGNTFQTGAERSSPAMTVRWVDEWDNADGSIERGYGGRSIFFEGGKVREDLAPVREYARLLASVGIDGCDVNNVNNAAPFLDSAMLKGLARVADAMRPWGVRLALSADVASPQKIGGLATYDPLDPQVKAWWKAKVEEIYALIPDFAARTGELWTNAGGGGEHAGGRAGSAWRGGVVSRVCLQPSSGLER